LNHRAAQRSESLRRCRRVVAQRRASLVSCGVGYDVQNIAHLSQRFLGFVRQDKELRRRRTDA
ncbi:hypothetical protein, partial [Mesorhizobium sp. M1A.F.Ca.IN.022.05.2.1]|uniref:hypothetical protein n=1 Tax=Mesorhizobium sp. M1A.F.Ca.IN.022.05.2.1 TaxID=2496760 RepID=UPI0019D081E9